MIEMIRQDMDEVYLLRRLGSPVIRPRLVDYPKHTPQGGKSANLVRWRTDWQGKNSTGSKKPTRAQALDRLESEYDITSQLPKGGARGALVHEFAYLGATVMIYLDPLDRIEG
tara:strand:- start:557 stop:895 length:339 start_codon:yes stop_codon:yes gene_type:complete